jgi:hypothetical protein
MRVQDKRTHYEICDLFQWANRDEFWKDNILSPSSLRKQWDQLTTKRLRATGTAKLSGAALTCITPTGLTGCWNEKSCREHSQF